MGYAILTTEQNTYGVKVPYGQGSYTVHYTNETEALESMAALNRAYVAGWNAALRSLQKEKENGLQDIGYPL